MPEDIQKRIAAIQEKLHLNYPAIEKLIETEDFEKINKSFASTYEALEKIGSSAGGLKKGREARKAMKALERTMDLLAELLKLKIELSAKVKGGGN